MWASILKIIELIVAYICRRKNANTTYTNKLNKQYQELKNEINSDIKNAHITKELDDIRKKAAE